MVSPAPLDPDTFGDLFEQLHEQLNIPLPTLYPRKDHS